MLSRIEIKEELELFIEWPTDDHGSVSATSTALFAHHVQQKATEKLRAELERVTAELEQYKRDAERMRAALESTNLLLRTKRHACASSEVCHILDTHIERNRAALSTQPDHSADKLEMVKPECACRVESDDNGAEVQRLREALKPFAECADQIDQTEDGEEWAKFRLLVKDYRAAYAALNQQQAEVKP